MARFVFNTGGVVSSPGKGIAAASLGALLQARGYMVRLRKLDTYLDDGAETDLDLGPPPGPTASTACCRGCA